MIINRRWITLPILLGGLIGVTPSFAVDSLQPLLSCRAITDSAARLACFDRESAALTISPPAPAPSAAAAVAPSPAPPSVAAAAAPKANFGLTDEQVSQKEAAAGKRPQPLKKIEANITAISSTGTGYATFTLDNGQVWREVTPDGDLLAKPGDGVTLSRGLLSSYWLQTRNGRGAKVHRVL